MNTTPEGASFWSVPRDWVGERCFIIGGGGSVYRQRGLIPALQGRVIAIKQSVILRPDADVWLLDEDAPLDCRMRQLLECVYTGRDVIGIEAPGPEGRPAMGYRTYTVVGGVKRHHFYEARKHDYPLSTRWLSRASDQTSLCDEPTLVTPHMAGIAAINLAYHFGATEIVLLGFDGGIGRHWWDDVERPGQSSLLDVQFQTIPGVEAVAADAARKGLRIVNTSPITRLTCFERAPLEQFLGEPAGVDISAVAKGLAT